MRWLGGITDFMDVALTQTGADVADTFPTLHDPQWGR